jgi:hypothetical protein
MSIKKSVEEALSSPVSRKEFLTRSGMIAAVVVGLPTLLKVISAANGHKPADHGYGASSYGGGRRGV